MRFVSVFEVVMNKKKKLCEMEDLTKLRIFSLIFIRIFLLLLNLNDLMNIQIHKFISKKGMCFTINILAITTLDFY